MSHLKISISIVDTLLTYEHFVNDYLLVLFNI